MSFPIQDSQAAQERREPLLSEDEALDDEALDLAPAPAHLYHAGECPAPGLYRQVEGTRTVQIHEGNSLPPSFNGRVACYQRVEALWAQVEDLSA